MAETYRVLAQTVPGAASLTDSYRVPAVKTAVISSIVVCNRSAVPTSHRIAVAINGAVDATKQYLTYDCPINGNETQTMTLGLSLGNSDLIRVYATLATLTFQVFGVEITA